MRFGGCARIRRESRANDEARQTTHRLYRLSRPAQFYRKTHPSGHDPQLLVRDLQDRFPKANLIGDESAYQELIAKVVGLIEKPGVGFGLPLDIRGTAFQQRVWKALQQIPLGSTATYSEIAAKIGMPKAVRAVAQACGANALAVAIPCHRVIRNDGSLSGYRWGVERKRVLLEREAHA